MKKERAVLGFVTAGTAPRAAQATFVYNTDSRGAFLKCKHTEYSLNGNSRDTGSTWDI